MTAIGGALMPTVASAATKGGPAKVAGAVTTRGAVTLTDGRYTFPSYSAGTAGSSAVADANHPARWTATQVVQTQPPYDSYTAEGNLVHHIVDNGAPTDFWIKGKASRTIRRSASVSLFSGARVTAAAAVGSGAAVDRMGPVSLVASLVVTPEWVSSWWVRINVYCVARPHPRSRRIAPRANVLFP